MTKFKKPDALADPFYVGMDSYGRILLLKNIQMERVTLATQAIFVSNDRDSAVVAINKYGTMGAGFVPALMVFKELAQICGANKISSLYDGHTVYQLDSRDIN